MAKKKRRKLWLRIRGRVPRKISQSRFWSTLEDAIETGEYDHVPDAWNVEIEWRNKEGEGMKSEAFASAMAESAESSSGFDAAVLHYIRRRKGA